MALSKAQLSVSSLIDIDTHEPSSSTQAQASINVSLSREVWTEAARKHYAYMESILYPNLDSSHAFVTNNNHKESLKTRQHSVHLNPIYNFLHTYYKYSAKELMRWSPGLGISIQDVCDKDFKNYNRNSNYGLLSNKYIQLVGDHIKNDNNNDNDGSDENGHTYIYKLKTPLRPDGKTGWIQLSKTRDLLHAVINRPPFFACYGYHEWAMLYNNQAPYQPQLKLRVGQDIIAKVVTTPGNLKCMYPPPSLPPLPISTQLLVLILSPPPPPPDITTSFI